MKISNTEFGSNPPVSF